VWNTELTIKPDNNDRLIIRLATAEDAKRITVLCEQLGYPTSQEEVQRRLNQIRQDERHAVYVGELDSHVIGWAHVYVCRLMITELQAEIGGLVVDEHYRRSGAGRLLMQRAEQWARENECSAIYLRSNVIRKDAHAFYERIGYNKFKTSLVFRKAL
jgi:N-acetylglutamate synthase-like GNAT family acetyltransferase